MRPEEINEAIAKACGWTVRVNDTPQDDYGPHTRKYFFPPGKTQWDFAVGIERVPNYHGDLNAMHEAESQLEGIKRATYLLNLERVVVTAQKDFIGWDATHATAAQRAEAFLRTLNLWQDSTAAMGEKI